MISNRAGTLAPRPYPPFAADPRVLCGPRDDATLFPDRPNATASAAAKVLCKPCPVRRDCLAYALEHEPFYGNYGGFTPGERRRIAKGKLKVYI